MRSPGATLKPGGTIVEGTAGNTGIGLAVVANAMGFSTVIVIPVTQSQEKKDALRQLGAELVEVPAVPYKNPNNYVKYSGRLAKAMGGASGPTSSTTSPTARPISKPPRRKSGRRPMARSMASSPPSARAAPWPASAMGLKAKNKNIKIALADPMGAALYSYYKHGELKSEGSSITEGIGQGRITANLEGAVVDDAFQIPDSRSDPDRLRSARA